MARAFLPGRGRRDLFGPVAEVTPFRPALVPDLLRGKTAWITGGGTGLGRAMALRFASLGAQVALSGRRLEPLEAVAAEIAASGGRAAAAPCDVRDPAQVDTALARVRETVGIPDILVNNAAGNFLCPSEDLTPNGFATIVAIVLHGTFHCTRAAGRVWIDEKRGGTVLSIATTYASTGSGFVLPSACGKAGVVALTRSLAVEWAHPVRRVRDEKRRELGQLVLRAEPPGGDPALSFVFDLGRRTGCAARSSPSTAANGYAAPASSTTCWKRGTLPFSAQDPRPKPPLPSTTPSTWRRALRSVAGSRSRREACNGS